MENIKKLFPVVKLVKPGKVIRFLLVSIGVFVVTLIVKFGLFMDMKGDTVFGKAVAVAKAVFALYGLLTMCAVWVVYMKKSEGRGRLLKSLIGIALGISLILPMTTLPAYELKKTLDMPLKSANNKTEMEVVGIQGQEIEELQEQQDMSEDSQMAEEEVESIQVINKEKLFTGEVEVGDILVFGEYGYNNSFEVKDLQWRVLEKTDTKCLVTTTYVVATERYDYTGEAVWETSKVREYLNKEFFNDAFNDDEKNCVMDTNLVNTVVTDKGIIGGNDTVDKVFLLTVEDVLKYMPEDRLRRIMDTEGSSTDAMGYRAWMLRTPIPSTNEYQQLIAAVGMKGQMVTNSEEGFSVDSELGVRPAMWIDVNKASGIALVVEDKDIFANIKAVELSEAEKFMQGQDNTYQIGKSLVEYGVYEQDNNLENGKEPIQWIVYDKSEDTNALMLISRYILDTKQFNDDVDRTSWEKSSLREWLNNEFYAEAFSEQEKSGLLDNTIDNVCLFHMGIDGELENTKGTPYAIANGLDYDENYGGNSPWWRRSQKPNSESLWSVTTAGGTSRYALSKTKGIGVRPVIWVDLDDVVSTEN